MLSVLFLWFVLLFVDRLIVFPALFPVSSSIYRIASCPSSASM